MASRPVVSQQAPFADPSLDVFGGRFSETLGYATKEGDELRFLFEYPDGPFRTTFVLRGTGFELDTKSRAKDGTWSPFAHYVARR